MRNERQRIESVDFSTLTASFRSELDQRGLGGERFSNFNQIVANAPEVLEAYLSFEQTLENSCLPASTREKIALLVSEMNSSEYDVAAHTQKAVSLNVSNEEIRLSRRATSASARDAALLNFARNVVRKRGILSEDEFEEAHQYECKDSLVVEIVAIIAQSYFANLINNVANTKLDFPEVEEIVHEQSR